MVILLHFLCDCKPAKGHLVFLKKERNTYCWKILKAKRFHCSECVVIALGPCEKLIIQVKSQYTEFHGICKLGFRIMW